MATFFSAAYEHKFQLFSADHLFMVTAACLLFIMLFFMRKRLRQEAVNRIARWTMAFILILCEVSFHLWAAANGIWTIQNYLPLELCSITLYLCVWMLFTKSYRIFEICYFTALGGATQAMLTPALGFPFPYYRFFEFFLSHIVIIAAALFMVFVEKYKPTLKSVVKTMVLLNFYAAVVFFINKATGGNYLFLSEKPKNGSIMDFLGPYPYYILGLEGIAVLLFILLYLPFAFKKISKESIKA